MLRNKLHNKIGRGQGEALEKEEKEVGGDGAISEYLDSEDQLKQANLIANEKKEGEVADELDIEVQSLRDVRKPDDKGNI